MEVLCPSQVGDWHVESSWLDPCCCVWVCTVRARRRSWTPPPPSHYITDSVAWYHHIKLVLMNTSESTEERDNQTFIKWLNLLYMHNIIEREMGLWCLPTGGMIFNPKHVYVCGSRIVYWLSKSYTLFATAQELSEQLLSWIKWSKYTK